MRKSILTNNSVFLNATDAFENLYEYILEFGELRNGTKAIFNEGFYLLNPEEKIIKTSWRTFNSNYAEKEWQWYLTGNRDAREIAKLAKIWENHMDENGNVNSNYGYQWNRGKQLMMIVFHQWNRGKQLMMIVDKLKKDKNTRQAVITIYDGKEHLRYKRDTPCTISVQFNIINHKLDMSVLMRSNDLIFGFCNDQYCFSSLQKMIADKLEIEVGAYFHYANNLHIYERHFNMKEHFLNSKK